MRHNPGALAAANGGLLAPGTRQRADVPAATEYQVKAAFLLNFARYVEWPAEAFPQSGQPFVVTVLGEDPFGTALDSVLMGRTIRDRSLSVRRAARLEDVGMSHILFIAGSEDEGLARILRRLDAAPTLTIGESPRFAEQGGMVRFRTDRDRVGFEINLASTEKARLRVSSQLLKLARIVGPGGKG
jgi:hypothetical protein